MPMRALLYGTKLIIILPNLREKEEGGVFFSKKYIYFLLLCVKVIMKMPVDYHLVSDVAKLIGQAICCVQLPHSWL